MADVLAAAPVTPGNVGAPVRVAEEEVEAGAEEKAAGRAGTDGAVEVEGAGVGAAAGEGVAVIAALCAETGPLRSQGFGGDGICGGCGGRGGGRRGRECGRWWWQRASVSPSLSVSALSPGPVMSLPPGRLLLCASVYCHVGERLFSKERASITSGILRGVIDARRLPYASDTHLDRPRNADAGVHRSTNILHPLPLRFCCLSGLIDDAAAPAGSRVFSLYPDQHPSTEKFDSRNRQ